MIKKKKNKTEWQQLPLAKAAEIAGYKESYLLRMASSGRLKAYKFGQEWMTTEEWLSDWRETLKKRIVTETGEVKSHSRFVKYVPKEKKIIDPKMEMHFGVSIVTLASVCLLAVGVITIFAQSEKINQPVVAVGKVLEKRQVVAQNFLGGVNQAYYSSAMAIGAVSNAGSSVLDYSTRSLLISMVEMERTWVAGGQKTVLAYQKINNAKIPDEKLTQNLRRWLAVDFVREKIMAVFNSKLRGRVAGDKAVWPK